MPGEPGHRADPRRRAGGLAARFVLLSVLLVGLQLRRKKERGGPRGGGGVRGQRGHAARSARRPCRMHAEARPALFRAQQRSQGRAGRG